MPSLDAEAKSRDSTLVVEIVELYNGGMFSAYTYKRYEDVRLVFAPELEIVYYRNNAVDYPANRFDISVHNRRTFDLWCRSGDGREQGVNNWTAFTFR